MRIIIQRVSEASVKVDNAIVGEIQKGIFILLGIEEADTEEDIDWLVSKTINLRIFSDAEGKMNLSVKEIEGNILVVSQFTLHASTKKGNRPSFIKAAKPALANQLYEAFLKKLEKETSDKIERGIFGADMKVSLINDGPVTIIMDTKNKE